MASVYKRAWTGQDGRELMSVTQTKVCSTCKTEKAAIANSPLLRARGCKKPPLRRHQPYLTSISSSPAQGADDLRLRRSHHTRARGG
jgi:hypothetical protein